MLKKIFTHYLVLGMLWSYERRLCICLARWLWLYRLWRQGYNKFHLRRNVSNRKPVVYNLKRNNYESNGLQENYHGQWYRVKNPYLVFTAWHDRVVLVMRNTGSTDWYFFLLFYMLLTHTEYMCTFLLMDTPLPLSELSSNMKLHGYKVKTLQIHGTIFWRCTVFLKC